MSVASSQRLTRGDRRALLILSSLLASTPLCAQVLDWEAAIAEVSPSNSFFTAVEAVPSDAGVPSSAFACGNFVGNFSMGPVAPLVNPGGQDGVVARFDSTLPPPPFVWDVVWLAQASSSGTGNVTINDLTLDNAGNFYVTGIYVDNVNFPGSLTTLTTLTTTMSGATEGFVAWGQLATGDFIDAFSVPDMEPQAIALDAGNSIYLTGPGALARKYPPGGGAAFDWNTAQPASTTALVDIALGPDPADPSLYVLGEDNTNAQQVIVVQLDRTNGLPDWSARVGGSGLDVAGGLAMGPDGDPRVAFSSESASIDFQSPTGLTSLPGIPAFAATHGVVLRIAPTGELVWSANLGQAQSTGSSMKPTSLSVDDAGNAFACAGFDGGFMIENQPVAGQQDVAVLGVDATGLLFDFHQSIGAGIESPTGVSAPTRDLVITVGSYENDPSAFAGFTLPVPNPGETHAFFGAIAPIPSQERYIITPAPGGPPPIQLVNDIHLLGGQVYRVISFRGTALAVAAYLTNGQLADLQAGGGVNFEFDIELRPDGNSANAGWALNHLNNALNPVADTYSYTCADTANTVNVYVIDTAVDNSSGWFDANTNLTIESTTLVRGVADPLVSSVFQHGTEMLSLIGGPHTGAALGTPIVMKNFDFYPNGSPSTASLLADAIYQAIDYHLDFGDCAPGVVLISSSGPGSSVTVSTAIGEAITEGIPVVVSAGNGNANASGYVPASDGSGTGGVICVGGSKQDLTKEAGSNHTAIDLSAPGDAVRVIKYATPFVGHGSFTGTSASAALTAGVAAAHLSVNPWSTPSELEAVIFVDTNKDGALDILQLAAVGATFTQTYDKWTAYYSLSDVTHAGDDDGDGWNNLSEYFHGLKPTVADPKGAQSWITYSYSTGKYSFTFNISTALLDTTSLGTMLDSGTYEATDSTTATGFTTAPGSLSIGSSTGKQTTLKLENTVVDPKCFMHVEVTPASPSP